MTVKIGDAILIDDDIIIRMSWQRAAQEKGKKLFVFAEPEDFLSQMSAWDRSIAVYVDSNLGKNILGEQVARKIYDFGFTQVYICTGYPPAQFSHLTWLREVVGKQAPW